MQLSQILQSKGGEVVTIHPDATVAGLVAVLEQHRIGALVVSVDGTRIDGIVSERDVVRALVHGASALEQPVRAIMSAGVHCASAEATIDDLMALMTDKRIRHVPIVDADEQLIGIVSIGDVVKYRLGELEGERAALMDYITRGG